MRSEDRYLDIPTDDVELWRYMDFVKFVSLLEYNALFFPRADKLGDSFEGYWPISTEESKISPPDVATISTLFKALIPLTLISCWHEGAHESKAMWNLYSNETDGIAIRTDFGSLMDSFKTDYQWMPGRVKYIHYEEESWPVSGSYWRPFLHKRRNFEGEREVRIIIQEKPDKFPFDFTPLYDAGNHYKVDLSILVHQVIVAPRAKEWLLDLVQTVAARYNLKASVVRSALADNPKWA